MSIPEEEKRYYAQLFSIADADQDGRVSGQEGAAFLRRCGLPDAQLMVIWELADGAKTGFLGPREFAVCMRLIALAQDGKDPRLDLLQSTTTLPKFKDIAVPAIFPSTLSSADLYKYDQLFLQADLNKDGFVDGMEAKNYFSKSKLSTEVLARVWELSEIDKDTKLNLAEFRIAMHLLYWTMKGEPLPSVIPAGLIQQVRSTAQYPPTTQPSVPISSSAPLPPTHSQQPVNSSFGTDAFGSSTDAMFTPAAPNHNYDQSKLIAQHTLPGTTFEQRVNFNSELSQAMNKHKK